jgi:methylmalonyl-CoA/ethylmalonyl-CoA epimerase
MFKKIDHLGIAVKSIDEIKKIYSSIFGVKFEHDEIVSDQKVKTAMMNVGESRLEFLEAVSEDSPISRFIQKKGEGIHHICFQVENLEEKLTILKSNGVQLIDEKARKGAGGNIIAFIHPKSTGGILVELAESVKK